MVFVDGTFKSCPKLFMQLFTIHFINNNHYILLVFCLFPDKRKETYMQNFQILYDELNNLNPLNHILITNLNFHQKFGQQLMQLLLEQQIFANHFIHILIQYFMWHI